MVGARGGNQGFPAVHLKGIVRFCTAGSRLTPASRWCRSLGARAFSRRTQRLRAGPMMSPAVAGFSCSVDETVFRSRRRDSRDFRSVARTYVRAIPMPLLARPTRFLLVRFVHRPESTEYSSPCHGQFSSLMFGHNPESRPCAVRDHNRLLSARLDRGNAIPNSWLTANASKASPVTPKMCRNSALRVAIAGKRLLSMTVVRCSKMVKSGLPVDPPRACTRSFHL